MRRCLVLLVALVLFAGCAGKEDAAPPAPPVSVTAEKGPVTVTMTADPGAVEAGGRFTLTIDAVAEPGVTVAMPAWEETFGSFDVHATTTPPDVPDGTRRRWTHTARLGTFQAGDLELPALDLAFLDERDATNPIESAVTIGPLTLPVESWIDGTDEAIEPAAGGGPPRDIRGIVDVPGVGRPWWHYAVLALLVAALLIVGLWWWRRRRVEIAAAGPPPVPAHIWARRELDALSAEGLAEAGQVHEYFFRLSDVVRQYLERRFSIHAPEWTTEEFIREMRRHPVLNDDHQGLLRAFLRSADMVKFARHEPPREACGAAMDTARTFVEQTRPREAAA